MATCHRGHSGVQILGKNYHDGRGVEAYCAQCGTRIMVYDDMMTAEDQRTCDALGAASLAYATTLAGKAVR